MKPIVKTEHLGKRYLVGLRQQQTTLREVLGSGMRASLRLFRNGGQRPAETIWALKDVSFEVAEGEVIGIIGRNGAGKSTLLKILSRITKPTTGRARIRGRVGSLLEVGTGFHSELTGRENILLNGAILGMRRAEIERKFDEIVAFSEVEKFLDTPVKHYSSGMYLRLAFSIAAHLEPEVLIVDEVLAVGDIEFQNKCLGKMDEVSKSGRTVLFVSHNLGSLAQICQKGLLLHKGELRSEGAMKEVINDYLGLAQTEKHFKLYKLDDKEMQITEAFITNKDGLVTNELPHDEEFFLEFKVRIKQIKKGAFYCVALLNQYKERVFSEVKAVEEFLPKESPDIHIKYEMPSRLIAPNNYSFLLQIFLPTGEFVDNLPDICPFSVVDTGSELSTYKDYGYVQMKAKWQMV